MSADDRPGITRRRRGSGFSYLNAFGATVGVKHRARIEALAIPPAWESVWICPVPDGYLQEFWPVGQGAGGIDDLVPAGALVERFVDEAEAALSRAQRSLG